MDNQKITDICKNYYITPNKVEILRNNERVFAKVETSHTYFLKGKEVVNQSYREACCTFANLLNAQGLNATQFVQSKKNNYVVQYEDKAYSLELALQGKPIKVIHDREIADIGQLLGVLHRLSIRMPNLFTNRTSSSLFRGITTMVHEDYDENELSFLKFKKHYYSYSLFSKVESLYKEYRYNLQQIWMRIPQGAVKGNFYFYNMLLQTDRTLAIYDFSRAGNEVYLNEVINVGVYHAWHAPYQGNLKDNERFQLFMESYTKERPLDSLEKIYVSQLIAITRAFQHDRIELGNALENELMKGLFLKETLKILEEAQC
nr:hypothetical protein [Lysinibacillus timonensis]